MVNRDVPLQRADVQESGPMPDQRDESTEQPHGDLDPADLKRELRQLRLLGKTLDDFRSNRIPIQRAINELEALAQELHHASPAWHDSFVDAWADLEVPYAVALDQRTLIPDATDWTVRDGLYELGVLIAQHRRELGHPKADERYPCPCCGHLVFVEPPGSYDICPICFWEDDLVQLRWPDYSGGANQPSLIDAQTNYKKFGAKQERILEHVRSPNSTDTRDPEWRTADPAQDRFEPRREKNANWPDDPTVLYWWRPTYWR